METVVPGTRGKMVIVFEDFGSGLPATVVTKEANGLYSFSCLITESMATFPEKCVFPALDLFLFILYF